MELTATLRANRARLLALLDGLPEEQMLIPDLIGRWSIKDLLAHLAGWEDWAVQVLTVVPPGETMPAAYAEALADFDAFNAESVAERDDYSPDEQLVELERVHEELIGMVERLGADGLAQTFRWPGDRPSTFGQFVGIFAHHDLQHLDDLQQAVARAASTI